MAQYDIDNNYGQVAETIHNHGGHQTPPDGHPNGRDCPQCGNYTWRFSEWCHHCGYNLFAHDARLRQEAIVRRKTKALLIFGPMGFIGMFGAHYFPDSLKGWVMGIGAVSILVTMGIIRD